MVARIQVRRGTSKEWGSNNPTLSLGEPAVENDTMRMKIGDGVSRYSKLKYIKEEDDNNLFLSQVWLTKEFLEQFDIDDEESCIQAFEDMSDYWCGNLTKHNIEGKHLSFEIFDFQGNQLGKFGPNLSTADIMRRIKEVGYNSEEVDMGHGIQINFYIETVHGTTPHLVLYNDLYGAVLGDGFKSTHKAHLVDNYPSEFCNLFMEYFYKRRFNYNISGNEEKVQETFFKVARDRAYLMYEPQCCLPGRPSTYVFYVRYSLNEWGEPQEDLDHVISQGFISVGDLDDPDMSLGRSNNWYWLWLCNKETGEIDNFLSDYPIDFPDEGYDDEHPEDYEIRGPVVIYEFSQWVDNEPGLKYYKFRVGGCGANRIVFQSNSMPSELGITEEDADKSVQIYVQYKHPALDEKVALTDMTFDTTEAFEQFRRCWPYSIRVNVRDIMNVCKQMRKSNRGQMRCRFGFYNPRNNKFSKPSEWFKISLRHNGTPITAVKFHKY